MCAECGCTPAEHAANRTEIVVGADLKPEPGGMNLLEQDGTKIVIANVAGDLYAFDATCTHQGCSLADGELEDKVVVCPCHHGEYDIETGEVLAGPPPAAIRTYKVRLSEPVA